MVRARQKRLTGWWMVADTATTQMPGTTVSGFSMGECRQGQRVHLARSSKRGFEGRRGVRGRRARRGEYEKQCEGGKKGGKKRPCCAWRGLGWHSCRRQGPERNTPSTEYTPYPLYYTGQVESIGSSPPLLPRPPPLLLLAFPSRLFPPPCAVWGVQAILCPSKSVNRQFYSTLVLKRKGTWCLVRGCIYASGINKTISLSPISWCLDGSGEISPDEPPPLALAGEPPQTLRSPRLSAPQTGRWVGPRKRARKVPPGSTSLHGTVLSWLRGCPNDQL